MDAVTGTARMIVFLMPLLVVSAMLLLLAGMLILDSPAVGNHEPDSKNPQ